MRHECCPATMTPESLSDWIKSNKIEQINHREKIPLTEEEINQYQKDATLASIQIKKLEDTEKFCKNLIKKGTPWDSANECHRPFDVTIPATKGLEKLEANRTFACQMVENGYKEDITHLYLVPWPEYEKMIAMDIEGNEWTRYSRNMSKDEAQQHARPVLRDIAKNFHDGLAEGGMKVEGMDPDGSVRISTGNPKKKKSEDLDDIFG